MRARVKWQQVGDKCSAEFFKLVWQKNSKAHITELKDKQGQSFTRKEDLENICYDFYRDLYKHKDICESTLNEVMEGFLATFTNNMNDSLAKDITEKELSSAVMSMAKGKASGHDGIPVELFQKLWSSLGQIFFLMISKGMENGALHEGITKGFISLIPKSGNAKDFNY